MPHPTSLYNFKRRLCVRNFDKIRPWSKKALTKSGLLDVIAS